jgi:hypothetical protein
LGRLCTGDDYASLSRQSTVITLSGQRVLVPAPRVLVGLMTAAGGSRQMAHAAKLADAASGTDER